MLEEDLILLAVGEIKAASQGRRPTTFHGRFQRNCAQSRLSIQARCEMAAGCSLLHRFLKRD